MAILKQMMPTVRILRTTKLKLWIVDKKFNGLFQIIVFLTENNQIFNKILQFLDKKFNG